MIPSYSEDVKITVIEKLNSDQPLEHQIRVLQEQIQGLAQTVDYINRERSRMKSEIDSLKRLLEKN